MDVTLVLDLDGTMIHRKEKAIFWAEENVRTIFRKVGGDTISRIIVFSFAIWSQSDIKYYTTLLRTGLESIFGVFDIEFVNMRPMADILLKRQCGKYVLRKGIIEDAYKLLDSHGKRDVFLMYMRMNRNITGKIMFFDDTVIKSSEFIRYGKQRIEIYNVYGEKGNPDWIEMETGKAGHFKK